MLHRVIEDGRATDGRLGLVECRMPAGWPGPPQHVHRAHDETFFVLTGRVRVTSGADTHALPAGRLFAAAIGTPHTFGNADTDEPASLLLTVTPQRYIGYFRELQQLRLARSCSATPQFPTRRELNPKEETRRGVVMGVAMARYIDAADARSRSSTSCFAAPSTRETRRRISPPAW